MAPRRATKALVPHDRVAQTTLDKVKKTTRRKAVDQAPNRSSAPSRKHHAFKLTRACLTDDGFDEKYVEELLKSLPASSLSTWGATQQQPVLAPSRKRPQLSMQARRGALAPTSREAIGRCVAVAVRQRTSFFMQLPLEIRERVFRYLLCGKPILLDYKLGTVLQQCSNSHAILLVCRQIFSEASSFLYRSNSFVAMLLDVKISPFRSHSLYEEANALSPRFLPFLRTVAIECPKWGLKWLKQASCSIEKLREAEAFLTSLTLIFNPQRVGMSTTALGLEAHPVTFADFLWAEGRIIQAVRKLRCRHFNVIIKKPGERRLLMTVLLVGLHCSSALEKRSALVNVETIQIGQARQRSIEEELAGLKNRFERIFEDDGEALRLGLCTEIAVAQNMVLGVATVGQK